MHADLVSRVDSNKDVVMLKKVIFPHHPKFQNNKRKQKEALEDPSMYNICRLVEQAMAHKGVYLLVDQISYDLCKIVNGQIVQKTEVKTGSVMPSVHGNSKNSYEAVISGVISGSGVMKEVIKTCVYNPHTNDIDFFSFTEESMNRKSLGVSKNSKQARCLYNTKTKTYSKWEDYRYSSFEEMCLA